MMSEKYGKYSSKSWWQHLLLLLFTIHYSLFTLAQVGTWKNYLAYHEIQDIQATGNILFILASNNLYQYNLDDQSITTYDKTSGLSDTHVTHIGWSNQAKRLIAIYENSNIDLIETNGNVINISALYMKTMTEDKTVTDIRIDGVYAYLITSFAIIKVNMQKAEISETYTNNHPEYPKSLPEKSTADFDKYISLASTLSPIGPDYNEFYEGTFVNNRLYTTRGFFLPGINDPQRAGAIQMLEEDNWTVFGENIDKTTGYNYKDISCITIDPNNEGRVIIGGRCGLYEFIDGTLTRYFNKDNSPLKGAMDRGNELGNTYVLILGACFDENSNLWVLNSQAKGVSLLELTASGEWIDHHNSVLTDADGISLAALRNMFFDSRGLLWFVNDSWFNPAVFCCDTNNEIILKYNEFINQDGTKYGVNYVYTVNEDKEGNIWVGTDAGPFMIQKSDIGQDNITFYQVKVPRNDGTNYADYLLSGVSISSIAIDGGNRKWFGTNGAGVFLISADNMEQIHSFTASNSKLITDNISSIVINQQSGEVFFLSDKGLCSYMSDATAPSDEMTDDQVYAYPNPVTPDYTGLITIMGLTFDADVKIASSNGALIAEGRSNGGMFTWDGCDRQGRRVASGIYMVITATSDGKKGTVCKIAVIN